MKTVKMDIGGMHCGACATGIQMVTEQMEGIESSSVDLDSAKGEFTFDESKVSEADIIAEIEKLEYTAKVAE